MRLTRKEVLMIDHNFHIQHPEEGANLIRTRFCHMRVLLVLDDVDSHKQLEFLTRSCLRFGPGSRIVITTRDEQLLSKVSEKYKPDLLEEDQALELFSRHAFEKTTPKKGYEELSSRAIRYAGHLPLAIKVLGSFFNGLDNAGEWESALNRFSKEPNQEIFEILKLSFDRLTESEKKIFLDIACFFKGKHVNHVKTVLDSFDFHPEIGISVLIKKSLVIITSYGVLRMHDLIQEMGWQILRESYPNSRLWQHEEIHNLIKNTKKLDEIEAIVMPDNRFDVDEYEEENVAFSADIFGRMKNLRLLDINGKFTSCEPTFLPSDLRWLRWKRYPFSSLPLADMRKLVGLEVLGGTVAQFWNGHQIMRSLKFMKLEELECLTRFPDVSGAPNIEYLSLDECKNLVDVHESLLSHKRLVTLRMDGCEQLKHLPSTIEMESLVDLSLGECYSLESFPDVSLCMKLSNISLGCGFNTYNFLMHRFRYWELKNIESGLCSYKKLQKLPENLGSMENMKILRLGLEDDFEAFERVLGFKSLHILTNLYSLTKLDLQGRQMEDRDFPKDLHSLSSLENLNLSGNYKLIQLPSSLSHLSNLRCLVVNECHQLRNFHGLPSSLKVLNADDCSSLENIEDASIRCERLFSVSLVNCHKLLEDKENERHLHKIFDSFVKRNAAVVDDVDFHKYLDMRIPGSKIPRRWLKEEEGGGGCRSRVALKQIPQKHISQILGIFICAVFLMSPTQDYTNIYIDWQFEKDEELNGKKEFGCLNASSPSDHNGNFVWIRFEPVSAWRDTRFVAPFIRSTGQKPVRCVARLVYNDDVKSLMPLNVYSRRSNHKRKQQDYQQDHRKLSRLESP